ncbi:MAG: type II toxin-antitoxin system HipA family toxin [Candidatus Nanopelagicales bacterium]
MAWTSDPPRHAYVWAWLPGHTEPVLAGQVAAIRGPAGARVGRAAADRTRYRFAYSSAYLDRADAISLYTPELPLVRGWTEPGVDMPMAGCLRDASPDSWGQRVIIDRLTGVRGPDAADIVLDDLTYLLESGSNRIGALDFQSSATEYVPRDASATLDELHGAAQALQDGTINDDLALALAHGTAVGGARPKVLITDNDAQYIAKLSTSSDQYANVKAEALGLELARRVGIEVPEAYITESLGRDVLMVRRFDRHGDGTRRMLISGLTMQGFADQIGARWSSYPDMLDVLRHYAPSGTGLGEQVLERICLNVLITNIDDHARNHAAFWDGTHLQLTPAYDLCPHLRGNYETRQAMDIGRAPNAQSQGPRNSTRSTIIAAAEDYGVSTERATDIFDRQVEIIRESLDDVVAQVRLTDGEAKVVRRSITADYTLT